MPSCVRLDKKADFRECKCKRREIEGEVMVGVRRRLALVAIPRSYDVRQEKRPRQELSCSAVVMVGSIRKEDVPSEGGWGGVM